jgi:hypothetical protein
MSFEKLIEEAVFLESRGEKWSPGLWDSLKPHVDRIEKSYLEVCSRPFPALEYYRLKSTLYRILQSVSASS